MTVYLPSNSLITSKKKSKQTKSIETNRSRKLFRLPLDFRRIHTKASIDQALIPAPQKPKRGVKRLFSAPPPSEPRIDREVCRISYSSSAALAFPRRPAAGCETGATAGGACDLAAAVVVAGGVCDLAGAVVAAGCAGDLTPVAAASGCACGLAMPSATRTSFSTLAQSSLLSRREFLEFSRPCPRRSPLYENQAPDLSTTFCSTPRSINSPYFEMP